MEEFNKKLEKDIESEIKKLYCPSCNRKLVLGEVRFDHPEDGPIFIDRYHCEKCRYINLTVLPCK